MASRYVISKAKKKSFREIINEHILSVDQSNARITAALMVGAFFSVAPIWGFQMLAIIGVCIIFQLNKPLAVIIAQLSLPPFIPLIIYLSYKLGGWFFSRFTSKPMYELNFSGGISLEDIYNGFAQYAIGALMLGVILSLLTALIAYPLLLIFRKPRLNV